MASSCLGDRKQVQDARFDTAKGKEPFQGKFVVIVEGFAR